MGKRTKGEMITFKVDGKLAELMSGLPNRSAFIRGAVLAALENTCPLCVGTGILTPEQRKHWDAFAKSHTVKKCKDCEAVHLVCNVGRQVKAR